MENSEKIERVLIPFSGGESPKNARKEALKRIKKGGSIFILHVADEAMIRKLKSMWGEVGDESEIVKNVRETQERVQEKVSEDFFKETRKMAAKKGASVEPLYGGRGEPVDEILEAIREKSIQLVVIERVKGKFEELLLGDELKSIEKEAPCEVKIVSGD